MACAITAYSLWGIFPLFWQLLGSIAPLEVVAHRVVWSTAFLLIVIPALGWRPNALGNELIGPAGLRELSDGGGKRHRAYRWWISLIAAVVISTNWLAFIWAVNNDRVLDSSLGYYISPLVNVALGVLVLGERLTRWQWLAIAVATAGVLTMSIASGAIPWVSLAMAVSFGLYGLLKKQVPIPALLGLLMENVLLCGPALIYLAMLAASGDGAMGQLGWQTDALLITGGVVTVPPLMLFALAVRRVTLSTIGILQYIGPTLQFLIGVGLMGEPFGQDRMIGFALVWAGSLIYIAGAHHAFRQRRQLAAA